MQLSNKNVLVTGATGGIGLAVSKKLIQCGVSSLGIVDLSEGCETLAAELNEQVDGSVVTGFCGDVTDSEFRQSVFETMEKNHGPVQICIPAAGIVRDGLAVKENKSTGEIELYPESNFRKLLDVNLLHPTYWAMQTIAGVARYRQSQGLGKWDTSEEIQGVIVLIGSVSSRGNRGQVGYAATKSALKAVCTTLNLEGLFHGVQTKIIHPGFVDTQMVDNIDQAYFEQHLKPLIGLGRKIQPDEIADIIVSMIENPVLSGEVWADASMTPLA